MKRALALSLAAVMLLALAGCGVSREVKDVQDQIAAIGEVTVDSEQAIAAAEAAYEALPAEEQEKVKNADVLTAARESLVMAFIDAIGEVTVDSEQAVTAAEAAYEALPAEGRVNIANADVLTAARVSLDNEKFKASLAGQWMEMCSFGETPYLTVGEDGVTREGSGTFPLEDVDAAAMTARADFGSQKVELTLDDTGERPVVTLALTVDGAEQEPVMLMQPEDHAAWCAENIVEVEITTDNLAEYIGGEIFLSDILNKEGEDIGDDYCCFASPAYDRGLVYVGCSRDFYLSTETDEGLDLDYFEEGQSPYSPFVACVPGAEETGSLVQNWDLTAVDGWGTMYYLPAEKVADVSLVTHEIAGHRDTTRVVTTTDGYKLTDKGNAGRYDNSNMYNYFYDADIQF